MESSVPYSGMAPLAIVLREGDAKVADAAEFIIQDPRHGEVFRRFFLDIEDIGMTVGTVQPLYMLLVREDRGRDTRHLGPERERPVETERLKILCKTLLWFYQTRVQGLCPVYFISPL